MHYILYQAKVHTYMLNRLGKPIMYYMYVDTFQNIEFIPTYVAPQGFHHKSKFIY